MMGEKPYIFQVIQYIPTLALEATNRNHTSILFYVQLNPITPLEKKEIGEEKEKEVFYYICNMHYVTSFFSFIIRLF